jgi:NAD-dependent DNA ligase
MGERKLKKVMESYPDVIQLYTDYDKDEIILKVKELDGFDIKTAEYFEEGLNKFIELFNTLSANMRKHLRISIIKFVEDQDKIKEQMDQEDNIFSGKIFVFSGFRNDEWEKIITSNGGKISNSVSSKTSVLVTTQKDLDEGKNSKIVKANELKVMVLTREEFEKQFINVYKVDLW